MSTLMIAAIVIVVLSIGSFLFSVSKKKMGFLYLSLVLFGLAVLVAVAGIYQFMSAKLDL
ncbi:MAG TPA: hypothetical protein VEC17_03835 [Candidatus Binatia bacterium]|nr:hypothetical protein [Candidatus Binatia bacterium]